MAALFNKDFVDFLETLDKHQVNFKNLADIEELEKKITQTSKVFKTFEV